MNSFVFFYGIRRFKKSLTFLGIEFGISVQNSALNLVEYDQSIL